MDRGESWQTLVGIGYKTLPYTDYLGAPVVADNMYLSLLVETGIAGLAALLWLNVAILRAAARASRVARSRARLLRHLDAVLLGGRDGADGVRRSADLLARAAGLLLRARPGAAPRELLSPVLDQFSDPGGAQQIWPELLPAMAGRGWRRRDGGCPARGAVRAGPRVGFAAERIDCGPYASGRKSVADAARFLRKRRVWRAASHLSSRFAGDLIYVNGPRLLPAAALARTPAGGLPLAQLSCARQAQRMAGMALPA